MIYRRPAFSLSYDLALTHHIIRQQVDSLSQSSSVSLVELTDERGVVGTEVDGGGAKSYDDEKAWSSINHSIPSDQR
jgi:hypothetical protein